jgi:hypothetical protein
MSPATRKAFFWRVCIPSFCVVSTAAYLGLSELARNDLKSLSYLDFLLQNFPAGREPLYLVLFVASCLLTGTLAGRQLRPWCQPGPVFCLFVMAAIVVPPQVIAFVHWPDGRGAIRSANLLAIGIAMNALLLAWALWPKAAPSDLPRELAATPAHLGWGGFYLALTACLFTLVFISASGALTGPDVLAYHLPLPALWFKTGSLSTGPGTQFHYPENAGLLLRWALASRSDHFVFVVPFLCAALTIYVLYAIGRAVGHSREVAAVCACFAAVCPVFVHLATTPYSETFGCLCVMLAVYFLLELSRAGERRPWVFLILIGLSLGMAAGARYSALPLGSLVAGCGFVLAWIRLTRISKSLSCPRCAGSCRGRRRRLLVREESG